MKPFNVGTPEFLDSQEFSNLISFINNIIETRALALTNRYPDYRIKIRYNVKDADWSHYPLKYNTPFFDVVCETLLFKDDNGYLEINEFAYQLNCFCKSIYHRKIWADSFPIRNDGFFNMIWSDWEKYQKDNEFDNLKQTAHSILDSSENLIDYHRDFMYNSNYNFITIDEVRDLFDQLVEQGIFLAKTGDLYQIFEGVNYDTADTDTKLKMHNGNLSTLDKLYIKSKFNKEIVPKLQKLTSKFNFIPIHSDLSKFEPLIALVKLDNKIWFTPQFLIFYS